MARVRVPITVIDAAGNGVAGASVRVQKRVGGADAVLYTSETGPSTATNPTTTDAYGRTTAWVDQGQYNAIVSGGSITTYTQPFDAASGENFDVSNSKSGVGGWASGAYAAHLGAAFGTSAAYVPIAFGVEEFDTNDWYQQANGRFTPQIAGIYRISLTLKADSLASQFYVGGGIRKNGVIVRECQNVCDGNLVLGLSVTTLVQVNGTTDYIDGAAYGGSASSGSPTLQPSVSNAICGELVGRA